MDDVGRYLWIGLLVLVFICVAMFFSATNSAISLLSEAKLRRKTEENDKAYKLLLKFKENESNFYMQSNICVSICIISAVVLFTYTFTPFIKQFIINVIKYDGLAYLISSIIAFILILFLSILYGQILPHKIAYYKFEEFAVKAVKFVPFFILIFKPFISIVFFVSNLSIKISGYNLNIEHDDVTEEEIRMMVNNGNDSGNIDIQEREMINNIFEFDDLTVGDVMTHRTDVIAIEKSQHISIALKIAIDKGFSRIPVYDQEIDNIVGVLYAKDMLELAFNSSGKDKQINDYLREVIYVPDSARCSILFKEFKEKKVHFAIIVDEYGGTAGIATMEDLIESILGNIQDEYDQEVEEIKQIDDATYLLDGGISIEDLQKLFGLELKSEDYETLSGLISTVLGRIPSKDETPVVTIDNISFRVVSVKERRVTKVIATINNQLYTNIDGGNSEDENIDDR